MGCFDMEETAIYWTSAVTQATVPSPLLTGPAGTLLWHSWLVLPSSGRQVLGSLTWRSLHESWGAIPLLPAFCLAIKEPGCGLMVSAV